MKSLLLLFLLTPTIISAMYMEGMDIEEPSILNKASIEPFWKPGKWEKCKMTDKDRDETLTIIQRELNDTIEKINECSQHIPEQSKRVVDLLHQYLATTRVHLLTFAAKDDRSGVDNFIDTYQSKETSIGQAVNNLENSLKTSQNPDNALTDLMKCLSVETKNRGCHSIFH